MTKRVAGGVLWAFAIYTGWQLCTGVLGFGDLGLVGALVSIAAGAVIAIDPRHVVWSPSETRRILDPAAYEPTGAGVPASRPHA